MTIFQFKEILKRIFATTVMKMTAVLGGGSVVDFALNDGQVDTVKNAALAALMGALEVIEALSKAYVNDGYLSEDETNAAFTAQLAAAPVEPAPEPIAPAVETEIPAEEQVDNLG